MNKYSDCSKFFGILLYILCISIVVIVLDKCGVKAYSDKWWIITGCVMLSQISGSCL